MVEDARIPNQSLKVISWMHKNTKVVHAPLPRSEDVDQHRSVIRLTAKGQARVADAQSSGETEGRPNWMLILMEKMGISRDHFGRLSFKKVVPRSCRTEAPQKAIPEDDTTNEPTQSFFGHPLVLMRRILGRKEGIESAHGPVLFYSDEIPLPHHNFEDVRGLRKYLTTSFGRTSGVVSSGAKLVTEKTSEHESNTSNDALDALGEALKRLSESAELDVDATHPVIQLLARRKLDDSSVPGSRKDKYKLGLVVEGGGMRGSVSAGMLRGLSKLGLLKCFDAVYGSSAGALNASYFLAGQLEGVGIYTDHIANKSFIDLNRLPQLRRTAAYGSIDEARENFSYVPVLNLEFLINRVMQENVPLKFESVLRSPVPLKIVSTSLDANRSVLLENFQSVNDLKKCLWSSACVPGLAGPPVNHRGHRLVDAAVFEAIPYKAAVADGCTHVLALLTRRLERHEGGPLSVFSDRVLRKIILSPKYMAGAWQEVDRKRKHRPRDKHVLQTARYLPFLEAWSRPPYIYPLEPPEECDVVGPLCIEAPTIQNAIDASEAKALRIVSRGIELVGYEPSLQTKLLWIAKRVFFYHKVDMNRLDPNEKNEKQPHPPSGLPANHRN